MRYRVLPDGTLADPKLLYDATADPRPGGPDGMKVDVRGQHLQRRPRRRRRFFRQKASTSPRLLIPERVANVAWGGPDRKTLYICASSSVYRVKLSIAGEPIVQPKPTVH